MKVGSIRRWIAGCCSFAMALMIGVIGMPQAHGQSLPVLLTEFTGADFEAIMVVDTIPNGVRITVRISAPDYTGDINSVLLAMNPAKRNSISVGEVKWVDLNDAGASTSSALTPTSSWKMSTTNKKMYNLKGGGDQNLCNVLDCNLQFTIGRKGKGKDHVHAMSFELFGLTLFDLYGTSVRVTSVGANAEDSTKLGAYLELLPPDGPIFPD